MKQKLLIANWKMNPSTFEEAERLAKDIIKAIGGASQSVVLCPPFPWITDLSRKIKKVSWGAQDVFWEEKGAYTGEVSPLMLKNSGVAYVILGHSERRRLGETDEMVEKKVLATTAIALVPIICVGETVRENMRSAKKIVEHQLAKILHGVDTSSHIIVAYEPVWAISANGGGPDAPESANEMIVYIQERLTKLKMSQARVIYGGSVNSKNISGFLKYDNIEGFLIGGASLMPEEMGHMYVLANRT